MKTVTSLQEIAEYHYPYHFCQAFPIIPKEIIEKLSTTFGPPSIFLINITGWLFHYQNHQFFIVNRWHTHNLYFLDNSKNPSTLFHQDFINWITKETQSV